MQPFEVLGSVLSQPGQLQFFVYLWLAIASMGVFGNHITARRVKRVVYYVGVTLLLYNMAFYFRLVRILKMDLSTGPASGSTVVISFLTYIAVVGGFVTAWAVNHSTIQQRGWLYRSMTDGLRGLAQFVESRANPVSLMRKLADWTETKADEVHPIAKLIEAANAANGET